MIANVTMISPFAAAIATDDAGAAILWTETAEAETTVVTWSQSHVWDQELSSASRLRWTLAENVGPVSSLMGFRTLRMHSFKPLLQVE